MLLKGSRQHCHHISGQLDSSRAAHGQSQREVAQLQHRLASSSSPEDPHLVRERNQILSDIALLSKDLSKVQTEALDLGEDIKLARRLAANNGTTSTMMAAGGEAIAREDAKGLLVMIKYLKAKFVRESYLRADLAHQKLYLTMLVVQKQKMCVLSCPQPFRSDVQG